MKRLALIMLLSACTAPMPPPGTARIEMSTGGTFFGTVQISYYADGTAVSVFDFPGEAPDRTVTKFPPRAYAALAQVLAEQGPQAKAAQVPALACEDFGADTILADPPIGGFDMISAGCPDDPAVTGLRNALLAALAALPDEP